MRTTFPKASPEVKSASNSLRTPEYTQRATGIRSSGRSTATRRASRATPNFETPQPVRTRTTITTPSAVSRGSQGSEGKNQDWMIE